MFKGYNFFDYKYNIDGYHGQDYDGLPRYIFIGVALLLIVILLILFRKSNKERVSRYLKFMGVFMTLLYIAKTTWESYYDITTGRGFNLYLLPFDTCSIFMWAALIAGFAKGKLKKMGDCWLATGGIVGGLSAILFLQALNYYPVFTFGAMYSMLWHIAMLFTGIWLHTTGYVESNLKTVLYGFSMHLLISLVVIPFDYIKHFDFMMYREAGGIPFIENLASKFNASGRYYLTTITMLGFYLLTFIVVNFPFWITKKRSNRHR